MSSVSKKKRSLIPKSRKETLSSYTQRQPAPTPGHQAKYVQNQDALSEQDGRPIKNISRAFLQHQHQRRQQQQQQQQHQYQYQQQQQQQQQQNQYQYHYPYQQQRHGFVFMQPADQHHQGTSFNDLTVRQQLPIQTPNQSNTLYIPPPSTLPSFESSTHRLKFGFNDSKNNVKNDASRFIISKRQKVTDLRFDGFNFPNAQLTPLPPKKTTTEKPSYQSNLERCKCMTKGKGYLYNYISYIMSDPKFNDIMTESREREKSLMRQLAKRETSRFIK